MEPVTPDESVDPAVTNIDQFLDQKLKILLTNAPEIKAIVDQFDTRELPKVQAAIKTAIAENAKDVVPFGGIENGSMPRMIEHTLQTLRRDAIFAFIYDRFGKESLRKGEVPDENYWTASGDAVPLQDADCFMNSLFLRAGQANQMMNQPNFFAPGADPALVRETKSMAFQQFMVLGSAHNIYTDVIKPQAIAAPATATAAGKA